VSQWIPTRGNKRYLMGIIVPIIF